MRHTHVVMHYEDGSWWADSPDLEGFTVVAPTWVPRSGGSSDQRMETRTPRATMREKSTA
jgi:hypothetical protein